jgi:HSP20 family protein
LSDRPPATSGANPQKEESETMTLIRWNPSRSRDLATFQDDMNRLFEGFFSRAPLHADTAWFAPPVDLEETAEEFVLRVDLPGVSQKDVKVSLMGDTLTIRGERKSETTKDSGSLHRNERIHGVFERTFTLGTPVRNDQVKAQYRDGVLEVRVPKAEEAKLREVEVQVG